MIDTINAANRYTREVKVTHVEKEVLVWVPVHAELTVDMEVADSASLAEAGLCSAEELTTVRKERDKAWADVDRLHGFEEDSRSADAARIRAEEARRRAEEIIRAWNAELDSSVVKCRNAVRAETQRCIDIILGCANCADIVSVSVNTIRRGAP